MIESELFLLDTNVLVYAYGRDEASKSKKAQEILTKCFLGQGDLVISNQNLAEFVQVMTKKSKLTFDQAMASVKDISNSKSFKKIDYNAKTVILALELSNQFKTPFWDSLLAATMKENGIFNIYTENANDFKIPWINVVNPFKS